MGKQEQSNIHAIYDGTASLRETESWKMPEGLKEISEEATFWINSTSGEESWEDKPEGFDPEDYAKILEYFKTPGKLQTACPNQHQWEARMKSRIDKGASDIFIFAMDTYQRDDDRPMSASKAESELAKETIEGEYDVDIRIIPHLTTSVDLGLLVLKFYEDIQEPNITTDELYDRVLKRSKQVHEAQVVADLDYLQAGGRISKAGEIIGNVLGIRPVIGLKDGYIVQRKKIRGKEQKLCEIAVDCVAEEVGKKAVRLAFAHCQSPKKLEIMREYADGKFNEVEEPLVTTSPWVLSVHLGPSAVIAALETELEEESLDSNGEQ